MSLFEAQNLVAGYSAGNHVLHGVSVVLDPSGVTAMSGVNGAGKSTFAATLAGRVPIASGQITFDGKDISRSSVQERVRSGIVLCPQGREVFPDLTVLEHLRLGALPLPRDSRIDSIDEVMASVPILNDFKEAKAGSLSGGQQQLVALGRAIVSKPRVLVIDEPSMGLAPAIVDTVYELLGLLHARGLALLVIEESPLRLAGLADRVLVMRRGEIAKEGGAELLMDEAVLTSALLGDQEAQQ